MSDRIKDSVERLLEREGGFVDHPADRGGPTNMGITLETLSSWRGRPVSVKELKSLERREAVAIYHVEYWSAPRFYCLEGNVPVLVLDLLLDMSVHHGPATTVKMLQRVVGVEVDGLLGPVTAEATMRRNSGMLLAGLVDERLELFGKILSGDSSQHAFALGWLRRVGEFVQHIPRLSESHPFQDDEDLG